MIIDVTIKGKQDLLIHKYIPQSISHPPGRKTDVLNAYAGEWKKTTYTDNKGYLTMPSINLMACLFDGAKGRKIGKVALTRRIYTSVQVGPLESHILVDNKEITIDDVEKNDWLLTTGAVVSGRRIDRTRTKIPPDWTIAFQIITLNKDLPEDEIRAIVDQAGKLAGLGDWRPSAPKKPGPYGTFEVINWKVN